MHAVSTGIVKSDKVKLTGRRCLPLDATSASSGTGPRGRIVRQDDNGAVIEVVCICGNTFHLNCKYAQQGEPG